MKKIRIDSLEFAANVDTLRQRFAPAELMATLYADGYGVGLCSLAAALKEAGVSRFAVTEAEELLALRLGPLTEEEEILLLRPLRDVDTIMKLADAGAVFTVESREDAALLDELSTQRSSVLAAHIRVDAGHGAGGFLAERWEEVIALYQDFPNVAFTGIGGQIRSDAQKRDSQTEVQRHQFEQLLIRIADAGFETGLVHISEFCPESKAAAAVRVGRSVLGRGLPPGKANLIRLGRGEMLLPAPRRLPASSTVGETAPTTLQRDTLVVTLPLGYENGLDLTRIKEQTFFQRLFHPQRPPQVAFWIDGKRISPLGGIGAQETSFDVTDVTLSEAATLSFDIDPLHARGFEVEFYD